MTEPLILEQLREWGMQISSGQLHRLITEGKERFHREKDEILRVGLRVSRHIHVDDTGARHQGKNGDCNTYRQRMVRLVRKHREQEPDQFLPAPARRTTDYVLNDVALQYMAAQKLPVPLAGFSQRSGGICQ